MDIILLLIAGFGLTNILVNGEILEVPRQFISKVLFFKKLISCSMCTGFWVGVAYSIVFILNPSDPIFYALTLPFAISGISWLLERLGIILDCVAHDLDEE